ncbi:MAG TPA: hypothetical protein VGG32_09715 [Thermoplasmata archaeon]|jgi:hypothetical protein
MDVHRVRRLAVTLIASQLRSGRSSSDPRSLLGQPQLIAAVDVVLFLAVFGLTFGAVRASSLGSQQVATLANALLPFLPLVAVGVVLVAGVMFELTTTTKFAGSDAANWLPLTPAEYVTASAAAIAYTYSPAVALALGGLLPFALYGGTLVAYLMTVVLTIVALFEGAVLVEMVRSATQRASAVGAGRRGQVTLVLRAVVLVVVILALQLAFNPVFLLGLAQRLSAVALVTSVIPFFWSTEALTQWVGGNPGIGVAFAVGQVAFVGVLVYLAGELRVRYWVPSATEVRLEEHRYAARNPLLALFGLSAAESALVSKDLKGLVRRREMLPTLVVPIVLVVLVLVEGTAFGGFVSVLWVGWVAGFFSLLIAGTSVGQERRALQSLFAYPLSAGSLVRAKATFVLVPSLVVAVALGLVVGVYFGLPASVVLGVLLLVAAASVVLTFWGLVFASRFSDFQERPRPQFLRPGGMLAATGSGMVLLFAILIPGTFALLSPSSASVSLGLVCAALAVGVGGLAVLWTVSGFRRLLRELPF